MHWYRNIALELRACQGVRCYDCTFENPQDTDTALPYLLGDASHNCEFAGCWFEEQDSATVAKWFVDLAGCNAWSIYGCNVVRKIGAEARALRIGSNVAGGQCRAILIANPRIVLFNNDTPDLFKHIEVVNENTECILIGGYLRTGVSTPVSTPLNLIDPTTKSMWLSNRRWRMPQVTPSENPNIANLHLGDVLSRVGRGLEAWNALAGDSTWVPLSVNRYGNQAALDTVPASSKNRGTMAWVDDEAVVKVWDGTNWKKLQFTP